MNDWTDIIRDRLLERPAGEASDWEWFEENRLRPMLARRRRLKILAAASPFAVAAALGALFLINPSLPTEPGPAQVSIVPAPGPSGPASMVAVADEPDVSSVPVANKPARKPAKPAVEDFGNQAMAEPDLPVETAGETEEVTAEPEKTAEVVQEVFAEPSRWDGTGEKTVSKVHLSVSPFVRGFRNGTQILEAGIEKISVQTNDPLMVYADDVNKYYAHSNNNHSEIPPATVSRTDFIPVSIGLDLSMGLGRNLSLTTGAEMAMYRSKILTAKGVSMAQKAYYVGIPLRLDWTFWESDKLSAWLGSGVKADRLVYGKLGDYRLKDGRIHWSLTEDVGIQYQLFPDIGLFFQPEISYYFKPSSPAILTYRTEHPLIFSIGAGLRFSF